MQVPPTGSESVSSGGLCRIPLTPALGVRSHLVGVCPLFQDLLSSQRVQVAAAADERSFRRKALIVSEGAPAQSVQLVVSGRAKEFRKTARPSASMARLLGPGDLCGWPSVVADEVFPGAIVAIEPTLTLVWGRGILEELFKRFPVLPRNAVRMLVHRLREQDDRYEELAMERVPRRIARALLRLTQGAIRRFDHGSGLELPLSRAELAALAATTMFTVSRVLSDWGGRGVVDARRGKVVLMDMDALAAIAHDAGTPSRPTVAAH